MEISKPRTFGGVDLVRFLSAAMVMLFHYGFWVWAYPKGQIAKAAGSVPSTNSFFSYGWIGVEIFFVISGFIIAFSAQYSTPTKFFEARVKRLVPAVIICAPVTFAVIAFCGIETIQHNLFVLFRTLVFWPFGPWIDSVYWTLGIEIAFYGIIWLLLLLGRFSKIEVVASGIGLLSCIYWITLFTFGLKIGAESRLLDLLLIHHGCFFGLGVTIWLLRFQSRNLMRLLLFAFFSLGCALEIINAASVMASKVSMQISYVVPLVTFFSAVAFICWTLMTRRLEHKALRPIGLMTYPLYLIHSVVGGYLLGRLISAGLSYPAAIFYVSVTMVGVSWAIAIYLEPILKNAIGRFFRKSERFLPEGAR
ncbi:acyltransferase [Bradyrhizobium yuanmingense]|uniref:acyltransferase family protein n=1 Tax=Bradyrhizobium TaxID=374 RepID=UPI001CD6EE59|nr:MULTISPECIES: acyltransferase [unclassified Bradyrhizobium]MCA1512313.1 acyltransferase [Bradyrhizobium sp. NBAIM01]UWU85794.1 acyltransferase [Bradyrhizobium sp. CB1024]